MASPPPKVVAPTSPRIKLHDNSAVAARHSIIASSAKGWSPLQINKRNGGTAQLRPQSTGDSVTSPGGAPRRTSSSFRHMATNSLVANSPFKNLSTREGAMSNGISYSPESNNIIHERRNPTRALGQSPTRAQGVASTPKAAIGLGISSPTKSPGAAIVGQRRASSERKVSIPSSAERMTSGTKENETPEKGKKRRLPRQSMAYRALVENEYVTHSPFLDRRDDDGDDDMETLSADLLASPSPRRISGSNRRRASPSANLSEGRISNSPSKSTQLLGSSPLREQPPRAPPTPTPTKSSLATPKRLLGPRVQGQESPSRKTVTFTNIPDVKEFDPPSADTSLNVSHDADGDDADWTDADELDGEEWPQSSREEGNSMDSEEGVGDESATADFMDSLIEEGLFSPPELDTPVFADQEEFEIPPEAALAMEDNGTESSDFGFLSTPSLGGETPLMDYTEFLPSAPHHVHTVTPHLPPGDQPNLPHDRDHQMLLNADAHQPATHKPEPASPGPQAHQDGPLFDPFLTIQTATEYLGGNEERSEGGVPLGRTSHAERVQARRMLATQQLGLGYPGTLPKAGPPVHGLRPDSDSEESPAPRHAALPKASSRDSSASATGSEADVFGAVISSPVIRKISNRQVSDVPELQGPSRRMAQFKRDRESKKDDTPKRGLPRPPRNEQPVQVVSDYEASESEVESDLQLAKPELAFSLPAIGALSLSGEPMFSSTAPLDRPAATKPQKEISPIKPERRISAIAPKLELAPAFESSQLDISLEGDETSAPSADDEPLTPPRMRREAREDSPRIPSFEFGDMSIDMASEESQEETGTPKALTVVTTAPSPLTSAPSTPTQLTRPSPFASPAPAASPSTPVRAATPATPSNVPTTPSRQAAPAVRSPLSSPPVTMTHQPMAEFGPALSGKDASDASTNTRVRQRISRELIRENVSKRMAAEGMGRPLSSVESSLSSPVQTRARPMSTAGLVKSPSVTFAPPQAAFKHRSTGSTSSIDKDLPPPPAGSVSPRSPTALQHLRDGGKESPKSALDRIMSSFGKGSEPSSPTTPPSIEARISPISVGASPSKVAQPVSILRSQNSSPPPLAQSVAGSIVSNGHGLAQCRSSRRRSASTGDAEAPLKTPRTRDLKMAHKSPRISLGIVQDDDSILDSMQGEFDMLSQDRGYRVREQRRHVRATYTGGVANAAGELDAGRAWHAAHEKDAQDVAEAQARAADTDAHGLLFVKILGVEAIGVPIPKDPTFFSVKLDNGYDYIYTQPVRLQEGARVNQEYCLSEITNNEFTLSLVVRQDPHILRLVKEFKTPEAPTPARLEPPRAETPSSMSKTSGLRAFFNSPRKNKHTRNNSSVTSIPPAPAPVAKSRAETIANYLGGDKGDTLGKTLITLEPIAAQCDAKVLEIRYPLFSMHKGTRLPDGTAPRKQVGKITLQILRLPPLPGLKDEELPSSIDEVLKALRHNSWHQTQFLEGTLTQSGGDCRVPRRRLMRLVGGTLRAVNEVTRKEMVSIDLSLATECRDLNVRPETLDGDWDPYGARPRTFRVTFADGETIDFTADKDADKTLWMDLVAKLIGKVPPNPRWARVLGEQERLGRGRRSMSGLSTSSAASRRVGPPRKRPSGVVSGA